MHICPSCGEGNSERARFCQACGAALAEPAARAEERKVVSVLFVDLVGHTARSAEADPEDVRARLDTYHARVKREIERFGGTVEKFVGDAVMAVFGAPVAHEDDAERAVRAGLRIVEELGEEVRAAVNTGEALVALGARPEAGEALVAGDVVNTAARLQGVAPAGALVVGELTRRATAAVIDYEELAAAELKGKPEPVPLWRALAARSRFGVDVEQPAAAPLVGREHELALLQEVYARALREPSTQLVTLSGEPGVGKSRLVSEFREWVDARTELVWWRQGRSLPYGDGIAFWAVGEVVKAQAGILETETAEGAGAKLNAALAALVEDPAEREWLRAQLAPLVGLHAAGSDRSELFAACRVFLESLAAARPLVLVLEDLHWADDALLDFVDEVADLAADVPLLVLCTARPELHDRRPGWGGGKRNSTALSLGPLSREETARLLASLLERSVLPAETQQELLDRAGGNPLYAEEFARMLAERGPDGLKSAPLPDSVQAVIAARLDTLPPERKGLLQDAAVLGKVFWTGALAAMSGRSEDEVAAGLRELARKELVRAARRSSVAGQAEYSFWHVLVRDVAYAQIPRAARAARHRAAAEWIERTAGDRVEERAELLVHHYRHGLELSRAAGGEDVEELERRLCRFLAAAGQRTLFLDAEQAERYLQEALELAQPGDPHRAVALSALTTASSLLGRLTFAEAKTRYTEALAELRLQGDALSLGRTLTAYSQALWFQGEAEEAGNAIHEAVSVLGAIPRSAELSDAHTFLASRHLMAGRPEQTLVEAEQALAIAHELSDERARARALEWQGIARVDLGDPGGLDDARESLRIKLEQGEGAMAATGHNNLADLLSLVEGPRAALDQYRTAIDFAAKRGLGRFENWASGEIVWPLFDLGEWDELLRRGEELLAERGDDAGQVAIVVTSYRAHVFALRGALAEAAALVDEFLPPARKVGDPQVLEPALEIAACIAAARGDAEGASDLVRETVALARERTTRLALVPDALRAAVAAAALADGEALLAASRPFAARPRHAAVSGGAILAEARGAIEPALELYEQARAAWASFGNVVEQAQAALGAGRCLVALGRDGSERLREARAIFADLRAAPLLAETDALLGPERAVGS